MDATLLVLAGGAGRRMGRPKALLPVAGVTLVEWLVGRLGPGFAEVRVASGGLALPESLAPLAVADLHPGSGPLAGIEAGLAAAGHEVVVAVGCDMPAVTPALLARLVESSAGHDAAVPRVDGRPQPACAAYRRSARPVIGRALEEGRRQARAVLAELDVRWLDGEAPAQFENLNAPDEYGRFLRRLGHP